MLWLTCDLEEVLYRRQVARVELQPLLEVESGWKKTSALARVWAMVDIATVGLNEPAFVSPGRLHGYVPQTQEGIFTACGCAILHQHIS